MYAVIWPDGRILADSTFKSEADALKIALGFPDENDIGAFKAAGGRVETVRMFREVDE